jgi:hypothetical protein
MPAFPVKAIGKNRDFTAEKCEFLYTRSTEGSSEVLEEGCLLIIAVGRPNT